MWVLENFNIKLKHCCFMFLTKNEEKMYDGECGPLYEWAMRFLAAYGDGLDAERLVKIDAACFDYYKTLEWALTDFRDSELYDEFFKTRMAVPTYTCIQFTEKDLLTRERYKDMGVFLTASCAPYLVGWTPTFGSHVASIESAVYVYINSVFGARTHRESYPGIFAVALTGKTPYAGLHTDEGRRGNLLVKMETDLVNPHEYDALGYHVGAYTIDLDRPVFTGIPPNIGSDNLKSLGAALQLQGSVGLYHIVGVTPEAPSIDSAFYGDKPEETIIVGDDEIRESCAGLSIGGEEEVDYVILGCPHYSIEQLARVANLLKGKKIHDEVKFIVITAPGVRYMADQMGIKGMIEAAGGEVITGCWQSLVLREEATVATDSAKCAVFNGHLGSDLTGSRKNQVCFGSPEECVNAALNKKWSN
jgi:predicted aconitase